MFVKVHGPFLFSSWILFARYWKPAGENTIFIPGFSTRKQVFFFFLSQFAKIPSNSGWCLLRQSCDGTDQVKTILTIPRPPPPITPLSSVVGTVCPSDSVYLSSRNRVTEEGGPVNSLLPRQGIDAKGNVSFMCPL